MKKSLLLALLLLQTTVFAQNFKKGDAVQIEWKGQWYPGKIMEVKNNGFYISYDGYGSEWYETVPASRLKKTSEESPSTTKTTTSTNITTTSENSSSSTTGYAESQHLGVETIWDLCLSQDESILVASNAYGKLTLLDPKNLSLITELKTSDSPVFSAAITSDNSCVVAGAGDGKLFIFQRTGAKDFMLVKTIEEYSSIAKMKFSPTGELYITGAPASNYRDVVIDVWDIENYEKTSSILKSQVNLHVISDISFTASGDFVAFAVSNDKKGIEVYSTETKKLAYKITTKHDVTTCSFTPDGKFIAAGGTDNKVSLYDCTTKTVKWVSEWKTGSTNYVMSVHVSPDGKQVAACGRGSGYMAITFDSSNGKTIKTFSTKNSNGNAIKFGNNGMNIYIALTTYGDIAKVPIVKMYPVK